MADYGTYASLTELKTRLGITDTTDDTTLLKLLEVSSRSVDRMCVRHFYAKTATKSLDGNGLDVLSIPDILSVTSVTLDENQDAVYEHTLNTTDYVLYPYDYYPKTEILMDVRQGDYTYWPSGIAGVQITGLWGYGDGKHRATPYDTSGGTVTVADATSTSVTASSGALFAAGQTILAGTEQMYISGIATNTLTVARGVNGTTAAAQAAATAYIYKYPDAIREAVLIGASRLWKRKDTTFATVIANPGLGQIEVDRGFLKDPDVGMFLAPYVKYDIGGI